MVEKKGALEVEVIRARGLVGKPGSKSLPGNLRHGDLLMLSRNGEVDVSLLCTQHLT